MRHELSRGGDRKTDLKHAWKKEDTRDDRANEVMQQFDDAGMRQ